MSRATRHMISVMDAVIRIAIDRDRIAEICRRHRIVKMSLYGSVIRDDFTPASDVDVLVELDPDYKPGFAFFGIATDLEREFGRRVDVLQPKELSPYYKVEVLREAVPIYVAARSVDQPATDAGSCRRGASPLSREITLRL